jgi:hypothetical protein
MAQAVVSDERLTMDPITLAATALSIVTPYLAKIAGRAAEGLGDKLAEGATSVAQSIWKRIKQALGSETAKQAAQQVEENPDDKDRLDMLQALLVRRIEDDETLRTDLERLLAEAEGAGVNIHAVDTGIAARHVEQHAGRDAVGRDQVNVSRPSPESP